MKHTILNLKWSSGIIAAALLVLPMIAVASSPSIPVSAAGVEPRIIEGANNGGNRTCSEVGLAYYENSSYYEFSSDRVNYNSGSFDASFPSGLTVSTDGTNVSFSSTFSIGAVIVKGSNDANVYVYNPQRTNDSGLAAPTNASGGSAGLSNITFCWNEESEPKDKFLFQFVKEWQGDEVDFEGVEVTFMIGETAWQVGDPAVAVKPGTVLEPLSEEVTGLPENCSYESDLPESYQVFPEYESEVSARSEYINGDSENGVVTPEDMLDELVVTNTVTCDEDEDEEEGTPPVVTPTESTPGVLADTDEKQQVAVTPVGAADAGGAGTTALFGLLGSTVAVSLGAVIRRFSL